MSHSPLLLLFIYIASFVELRMPCSSKQNCAACIQEPGCLWCSDPALNSTILRCTNSREKKRCGDAFLVNPTNIHKNLINRPLVSYESNSSEVVEVSPQKIHLKLRVNEPINITLKYARAQYPVDLYYLMDLSNSMKDDKDTLSSLGKNLEEFMKKYTSDFRLGFGSFVDKTVQPYTSTLPSKLMQPCNGCTAPYGFQNHMKLSSNIEHFVIEVSHANVSGNIDELEGGFDALMQAIVCHTEIGWRDNARRLLVFSTDSGFHMAGDGKLGGIVVPNDGKCHMDKRGMYTHSLLQDYPSVSHLNYMVRENAVNIIFAVTEPQLKAYHHLTRSIEGAQAGSLTANSSNILELVDEQYKKISSSVEMQDNAPDNIKLTYYTSCQHSSSEKMSKTKCDNLKIGEEVEFQVEVRILSCPRDSKDWNATFKIFPVGSQEATIVHVEMICGCSCEQEDDPLYIPNASECSNNGTYMCGICSCNSLHFGKKCECTANQLITAVGDNDCKPEKDSQGPDCSGRGICFCGTCQCDSREKEDEIISGKYCECDNFSCLRGDNQLCGGHGICDCGKCQCFSGWTGEDCMCTKNNENCKLNDDYKECSDHGVCTCGDCICEEGYEGRYCQQTTSRPLHEQECEYLLPCILCRVHKTGPLSAQECSQNCTVLTIEVLDELEGDLNDVINCVQFYENCRTEYQYFYNETSELRVRALKQLDCPIVISFSTIGSILGSILLLGILGILMWKAIDELRYRKEFAKFQKERELAKWDESDNPLYRQPISTFRNPTYNNSL